MHIDKKYPPIYPFIFVLAGTFMICVTVLLSWSWWEELCKNKNGCVQANTAINMVYLKMLNSGREGISYF